MANWFFIEKFKVSASCLKAIRKLMKLGHCPEDCEIFKSYSTEGNFNDLRMLALDILVEFLTLRNDETLLHFLLDTLDNDCSLVVRQHLIRQMCKHVPFKFEESPKLAEFVVNRLWSLMEKLSLNYRIKYSLAELYQSLFGIAKPKCLKVAASSAKDSAHKFACDSFNFWLLFLKRLL